MTITKRFKTLISLLLIFVSAAILSYATYRIASTRYLMKAMSMTRGTGVGSSPNYIVQGSMLPITGKASSPNFTMEGGVVAQIETVVDQLTPPADDLTEAHIYPNPFKPGTGGQFDAENITFKRLTENAVIRVFNVAGELVATLEFDGAESDDYVWDVTNDSGEKLFSGVYIYYITNEEGQSARGKFAVIR